MLILAVRVPTSDSSQVTTSNSIEFTSTLSSASSVVLESTGQNDSAINAAAGSARWLFSL